MTDPGGNLVVLSSHSGQGQATPVAAGYEGPDPTPEQRAAIRRAALRFDRYPDNAFRGMPPMAIIDTARAMVVQEMQILIAGADPDSEEAEQYRIDTLPELATADRRLLDQLIPAFLSKVFDPVRRGLLPPPVGQPATPPANHVGAAHRSTPTGTVVPFRRIAP